MLVLWMFTYTHTNTHSFSLYISAKKKKKKKTDKRVAVQKLQKLQTWLRFDKSWRNLNNNIEKIWVSHTGEVDDGTGRGQGRTRRKERKMRRKEGKKDGKVGLGKSRRRKKEGCNRGMQDGKTWKNEGVHKRLKHLIIQKSRKEEEEEDRRPTGEMNGGRKEREGSGGREWLMKKEGGERRRRRSACASIMEREKETLHLIPTSIFPHLLFRSFTRSKVKRVTIKTTVLQKHVTHVFDITLTARLSRRKRCHTRVD